MNHNCVKCGKENLVYHLRDASVKVPKKFPVLLSICVKKSCPAYSFLQAGLEPIERKYKFSDRMYESYQCTDFDHFGLIEKKITPPGN